MFDIGWMEMLVIAVVAIVVIGPKDLPKVMRTVGQWMSRARSVAAAFQAQMEEMARDTGVDEVRKEINNSIGGLDPAKRLKDTLDPTGELYDQMKAMTDVGSLSDKAPATSLAAVAADAATPTVAPSEQKQAQSAPQTAPEAIEGVPEAPLPEGTSGYKGPRP